MDENAEAAALREKLAQMQAALNETQKEKDKVQALVLVQC